MKILICWNPCNNDEQEHLARFLRKILELDSSYELDFVFDYDEFKEKKDKKEDAKEESFKDNYDSIIVLCELKWNNFSYSKLYGIELVQYDIREKGINIPVLFLSFLSREQILRHDDSKQIISTYALGNHFIQLPMASEDEIRLFKAMGPILSEEMEDNLNFVAFDKIVSTIRHDVNQNNIEDCKKRLKNIIRKKGLRNVFEVKIDDCITVTDLRNICDEIEPEVKSKSSEMSSKNGGSNYKVLLLEDENKEEIVDLITEAECVGLTITHCRNTSEAYKIIEEDIDNEYSVVVVDFRIWDNPDVEFEYKTMTEKQGYRFIEDVVKLGRRYTFVSFSELPRAFRLRIAYMSPTQIIPEDKHLVLSTSVQREAFITKLIYWADQLSFYDAEKASKDPTFITLYNFHKISKSSEKIDEGDITKKSKEWIKVFSNAFLVDGMIKIENLFDSSNSFSRHLVAEVIINGFEFKKESFDLSNLTDANLKEFSNKLIMRRLAIYAYSYVNDVIESIYNSCIDEHKKIIDEDKKNGKYPNIGEVEQAISEFKRFFGSVNVLNTLLLQGFIRKTYCYIKNDAIFRDQGRSIPAKTSSIMNKCLWIHHKDNVKGARGKKILRLSDIGLTREEEVFFRTEHPDLYKKWNNR